MVVFPVPPFWLATAMVLHGMMGASLLRFPATGGQVTSAQLAQKSCVSQNTGSALEKSGFLEETGKQEGFPSFIKSCSELVIYRLCISHVSRVATLLTAWEAWVITIIRHPHISKDSIAHENILAREILFKSTPP